MRCLHAWENTGDEMELDPETFEQIGQEDDVEEIIGDGNDDDST